MGEGLPRRGIQYALLIALSVGSLAIVADRTIVMLKSRDDIRKLRDDLMVLLSAELGQTVAALQKNRGP